MVAVCCFKKSDMFQNHKSIARLIIDQMLGSMRCVSMRGLYSSACGPKLVADSFLLLK